ncbi:MAG: hypothetical protein ACLPVY_23370 [Acidimicrobiia bacterium]
MRSTSRVRQAALVVAGASVLFGVVIGFWPVSVTVVGDVSYSCGSGFLHSRSTWKADGRAMAAPDQTIGISTATPPTACPSRVYRNRDFGYALVGLAAVVYAALLASAAFDPTSTPMTTRRNGSRRTTTVLRR